MDDAIPTGECPATASVRDYLEDRLNDEDCRAVEQHVDHCPTCQLFAEELTSAELWTSALQAFDDGGLGPRKVGLARPHGIPGGAPPVDPPDDSGDVLPPLPIEIAPSAQELLPKTPGISQRFDNLRRLGRGGCATVYLAHDAALRREVALKFPHPTILAEPRARRRFHIEIRTAAALHHPNIVAVYDAALDEEQGVIVYEFVDGPTLAEWLAAQSAPVACETAALILAEIAQGIHYAHERGIVHRDLKPSNVLLDVTRDRGTLPFTPKIADFGIAQSIHSDATSTPEASVLGSPPYMSPEQAMGDRARIGPASDLYALGAILYELLTGHVPIHGAGPADILRRVVSELPIPLRRRRAEIPRDLEAICLKCLEKRPECRYGTAELLADDLRNFLNGQATIARPLSPARRALRWINRHPAQATGMLTVLVALGMLVAVGAWSLAIVSRANREAALKQEALFAEQQSHQAERDKNRYYELNLLGARIRERSLNRPRGWIEDNINDIRQAAQPAEDEDALRLLRSEAVRALCSVELSHAGNFIEDFNTYGIVYSPDGRLVATGDNGPWDRGTVILFDADTRREVRRLTFYGPPPSDEAPEVLEGVRSLLFAPDGTRLFIGSRMGMVHVWNPSTGEHLGVWRAERGTGSNAEIVALGLIPNRNVLVTLSNTSQLGFWKWDDPKQLANVSFARSGDSLVVDENRVYAAADGQLREFVLDEDLRAVRSGWSQSGVQPHVPTRLAIRSDRRTLLGLGRGMEELNSFDLSTGHPIHRFRGPQFAPIHDGNIHDLQASADGRWLLSTAPDGLKLWDALSGEVIGTISNSANRRVSAAFHPLRSELCLSANEKLQQWKISENSIWDSALRQSYAVEHMDLSADGSTLAGKLAMRQGSEGRSLSNRIRTVSIGNDACLDEVTDPSCGGPVALNSDGSRLVSAYQPETQQPAFGIQRINLRSGSASVPVSPFLSRFGKPEFGANDQLVWYFGNTLRDSRSEFGIVGALNAGSGGEQFRWVNERSERMLRRSGILALAVGNQIAVASSIDGTVRSFDAHDGKLLREMQLSEQIVDSLCLPGDQSHLLAGTRSGHVLTISISDGRITAEQRIHEDAIVRVCGNRAGLVFTASRDGSITAWRFDTGKLKELFRWGQFHRPITDAVLSRDGSLLTVLFQGETGVRLLHVHALRERLAELGLDW